MIIALTILAVARVTRLITEDKITERPREAVARWLITRDHTQLAYLVFCSWCVSIYVGAAGAGAYWAWHGTMPYTVIVLALAASHVTGILASTVNGGD